jgi:hypothetical protein
MFLTEGAGPEVQGANGTRVTKDASSFSTSPFFLVLIIEITNALKTDSDTF